MIRIGYVRASTKEQKLSIEVQTKQLLDYGVLEEHLFIDAAMTSKKNAVSPTMQKLLHFVEEDENEVEVVVTKLDRWGRDLMEIEERIIRISEAGASFTALAEGVTRANTSNAVGMLIVRIFGAIAAMERDRLAERTREALAAKKSRGVPLGPPTKLSTKDIEWVEKMHAQGWGAKRIANHIEAERNVNVSKSTIARVLGQDNTKKGGYVPRDNHKYLKREEERAAKIEAGS